MRSLISMCRFEAKVDLHSPVLPLICSTACCKSTGELALRREWEWEREREPNVTGQRTGASQGRAQKIAVAGRGFSSSCLFPFHLLTQVEDQ